MRWSFQRKKARGWLCWSLLLLIVLIPRGTGAGLEVGLYKDGKLVERLGSVDELTGTKAGARLASESSSAPTLSEETRHRNEAFSRGTTAAQQIRDLLDTMKGKSSRELGLERQKLDVLFQEFL